MSDPGRLSLEEELLRQFYQWEVRGRGWDLWPQPVDIEPAFRPFYWYLRGQEPVDQGRIPSLFSRLTSSESPPRTERAANSAEADRELPVPAGPSFQYFREFCVRLPEADLPQSGFEGFLRSLTFLTSPLSFEIVGLSETIRFQMVVAEQDAFQVQTQLNGHFPAIRLEEQPGFLSDVWGSDNEVVVEFGLSDEFMLPLRTPGPGEPDPLTSILSTLGAMERGELAILQVMLTPVRNPWRESIQRAIFFHDGKPIFADHPEMANGAKEKLASPLFAVLLRVAASGDSTRRLNEIMRSISGGLAQLSETSGNRLVPIRNDDYPNDVHRRDLLNRETRRTGMILNLKELASLVHFPGKEITVEKLMRESRKTTTAPSITRGHSLFVGTNLHNGKSAEVTLSPEQRSRHCYIVGASGTGKSTLLLHLISQDVKQGNGVGLLDPHGDLLDEVLCHIPEERHEDVILFDPSDEEFPVGFNILAAHSDLEKMLLASDLTAVFRRLSTSWGDQMTSVLSNAILAFLESSRGGNLLDLRRFLVEKEFRAEFLETVEDTEVAYFWRREFPLLSGRPQAPLLTRLDAFLRPRVIRYLVGQQENLLEFESILDEGKIFLARLSHGAIGEENAYLLGTLLVTKLHQTAMGRRKDRRLPFYLYIDEFQHFVTPSMATILSGARKYGLSLTLAHQELQQLWEKDKKVGNAVISNPYTRICFRLGDFDARKLEGSFSSFAAGDLQNLGTGEAICRVERSDFDFNLRTHLVERVDPETADRRREAIVDASRKKYGRKRREVQRDLEPEAKVKSKAAVKDPVEEKVRTKPSGEARPVHSEPSGLPGRGSEAHKYLQQLVVRWAESKGYQSSVEQPVLDGSGHVDVSLKTEKLSVACEVAVRSTTEQEVGNIQKCLAAGFDYVLLVSMDPAVLKDARRSATRILSPTQLKKVRFLTPDHLFAFIEELAGDGKKQKRSRGSGKEKELLTARELEELLQIDRKTIYQYAQKGLIPHVRIQSNVRFPRKDVMEWLTERKWKPKPKPKRKK